MKILFLNQMAGPLFRELAEDLSKTWNPSLLYTGHPHTSRLKGDGNLIIQKAPEYDRRNITYRIYTWILYFCRAFNMSLRVSKHTMLFIVSNPPFLGLVGLFLKLFRRQKYIVLVYDIYPDLLVSLDKIRKGVIYWIWEKMNRSVYKYADLVVTISDDMAMIIRDRYLSSEKKIEIIPPWVNTDFIRPIPKANNWFVKKWGLTDQLTVLYSGNMGNSHDIETIIEAAKLLHRKKNIHFMFIGEGAKKILIENEIKLNKLTNVTLLPFQSENVLPYSLTSGDIGIATFEPGTEDLMVPSKAIYYLAAGLSVVSISRRRNSLSELLINSGCGIRINNEDAVALRDHILFMSSNRDILSEHKKNSRLLAEKLFSRDKNRLVLEHIVAKQI